MADTDETYEDTPERLGATISALRDARGIERTQMAAACGLPESAIDNLESGVCWPPPTVLESVARCLLVPVIALAAPRVA